MNRVLVLASIACCLGLAVSLAGAEAAAPVQLRYQGSSTVASLLRRLLPGFQLAHPTIRLEIQAGGSNAASKALATGSADLVGLSRPLTEEEREDIRQARGIPPQVVALGHDAVGVYVARENPLGSLTRDDLARLLIEDSKQMTWSDLGLGGDGWATRPISIFLNREGTGAQAILRETLLGGKAIRADAHRELVASSVVQGVATDPGAIGFASLAMQTPTTRLVPLAGSATAAAVLPSSGTCRDGSYPLSRRLVVVMATRSGEPRSAEVRALLQYLLEPVGQGQIAAEGAFPLEPEEAASLRSSL